MPRVARWKTLTNIEYDDMMKLTAPELKDAVKTLQRKIRENRLEFKKVGVKSPAFSKLERTGGQLSIKGKNRNELLREFVRGTDFLQSKTSSLKGLQEFEEEAKERIGITDWTRDEYLTFWEAYETFVSDYPFIAEQIGDSTRIQEYVKGIYEEDKDLTLFRERLSVIQNDISSNSKNGDKYNLWDYIEEDEP